MALCATCREFRQLPSHNICEQCLLGISAADWSLRNEDGTLDSSWVIDPERLPYPYCGGASSLILREEVLDYHRCKNIAACTLHRKVRDMFGRPESSIMRKK